MSLPPKRRPTSGTAAEYRAALADHPSAHRSPVASDVAAATPAPVRAIPGGSVVSLDAKRRGLRLRT
jgi:hypothetical protein